MLWSLSLASQTVNIKRIDPPHWYIGMKNTSFQLMVYGENISTCDVNINSNSVNILKVNKTDNPNYLFIDLNVKPDAVAGNFDLVFKIGKKSIKRSYELKNKTAGTRGFSPADLIYLLMPDRFANGNPDNDSHPLSLEKANRNNPNGRHGGDIQGIIDHLDYFQELGITALWLNPTLENNNPEYSYHGYAITDFYNTDPRHGSNEDYLRLSDELHKKGMKLIMDMIFNHSSINHFWMKDIPCKDWANTAPDFRSNFRGSTLADMHASESDIKRMNEGWFDSHMPDLNQHNPFLATYLIQNSIWWIEYAGLDGIRMDTHPYPFKDFMAEWAKRVRDEYPDITLLGETWLQKPAFTAYFSENSPISGEFNSHLNSVTDFPLYYATRDAFNQKDTWTEGLLNIYYIIAQDMLYGNPYNNVIFLDNHDLDRYFTSVGNDPRKFKMGLTFLLTSRGIPMLYYGTEILKTGSEHQGHGFIRTDFPGGWIGDKYNAFTYEGRTNEQNEIFDYIKKVAAWRKSSKPITSGKLMHFVPENNVYVYFRYTKDQAVMIMFNNHDTEKREVDLTRFSELLSKYSKGFTVPDRKVIDLSKPLVLPEKSALILELNN